MDNLSKEDEDKDEEKEEESKIPKPSNKLSKYDEFFK